MQTFAENYNIALRYDAPVIKKGWEGKQKGLKQVLWERGFIDESLLDEYRVTLEKDENGAVVEDSEDYSMLFMMGTCIDFAEEKSALASVGERLGVEVYITPKFHAEIAGEGIEYAWGMAKGKYRRMPLADKKGKKDKFQELVKACLSRNVLTTECIRKLSRRARAYICAYYFIEKNSGDDSSQVTTLPEIEALMKQFKTHRSALDFDRAFCEAQVRVMEEEAQGNRGQAAISSVPIIAASV